MIKLSFIVPVFNVEPYISCCIESLAQQNMGNDNIEIILVDDGSTDGSLKICRKYEKEFKNIRVLHQENKGANVARNLGLDCEVTGLGLKEAKEVVDGAPKVVKEGASKAEADEIKEKLEAEGAKVNLK